ncbi:MAG: cupin domain-containing protein [Usitatibacter sp.]
MDTNDETQTRREEFYRRIDGSNLAPLWTRLKGLVRATPAPVGVPHRWRYSDVRPFVLEAAGHISASEAERRVLILENPGLRGTSQITSTLFAGLQLIMPGEVAPAHRHTQSALRFIIEGSGAHTTVDDEKVMMEPGDFVVTPAWRWHEHGHEGVGPMVWLDGLDIPMLAHFNSTFREDHAVRKPVEERYEGLLHFPYSRARETLFALARGGAPDAHLGHVLRYEDPKRGGWAMPTIASMIRLLPKGFATRSYRSSDSMVFAAVEGSGTLEVGGLQFDLAPHDVAVVPGWMPYTLTAAEDWVLFSFSDRAAQEKLGFFRDERL